MDDDVGWWRPSIKIMQKPLKIWIVVEVVDAEDNDLDYSQVE